MEGSVSEHRIKQGTDDIGKPFKKLLFFLFETESSKIVNNVVTKAQLRTSL